MKTPPLPESVSDVVWIQTGFLGDIILTSGAIRLGMDTFRNANHHVVTTDLGCEVLRGVDGLTSVQSFKSSVRQGREFRRRFASSMARFRQTREDIARHWDGSGRSVILQPHMSYRSSLLARYLGRKSYRVAFEEAKMASLAHNLVPRVAVLHESARVAMLLQPFGVGREAICSVKPSLQPQEGDHPLAKELDRGVRWVGVAAGSVWGTKRWPVSHFASCIERLAQDPKLGILLLGSPAEASLVEELASRLKLLEGPLVNLAGKTSISDMRYVVPKLSLMISNDSSPVHFASAFEVPTISIFGPTVPEMGFGPASSVSRSLGVNLDCRPCSLHGPMDCPRGHFKCMRDLAPETVSKVAQSILEGGTAYDS